VLDLIEARLGDPLTLADLAREACLSPYHFSRLFREATGWPPHRYLVERRIEAAQAVLREGRASLAEVALDAGFGSQANFARTFRAVTGLTPGQYREMHWGTGSPASSQGARPSSPQRSATFARNFASSRNTAPAAAP
jgi:AraC family transcriptional regulator